MLAGYVRVTVMVSPGVRPVTFQDMNPNGNSTPAGLPAVGRLASETASYTVTLPGSLVSNWNLDEETTIDFLMAATDATPKPRSASKDSTEDNQQEAPRPGSRDEGDEDGEKPPIDLTLEVTDSYGSTARVPVSRYGPIRRPLKISILRRSPARSRPTSPASR